MNGSQYVIQPPEFPEFLFRAYSRPLEELIEWAQKEYQARLLYCSQRGYMREYRIVNEQYSPIRILAELSGFGRFCSVTTSQVWGRLSRKKRGFIMASYELRELLLKN